MTRFVGSFSFGRREPSASIAEMGAAVSSEWDDDSGIWSGPSGSMFAAVRRVVPESAAETQPHRDPTTGVLVAFDGRLDNRTDLLACLPNRGELRRQPDVALVAALIGDRGDAAIGLMLGDFALAAFDARSDTLILARDVLGVRPLYFRQAPDAFTFASEVKALAAAGDFAVRPNVPLLGEFLLGGSPRSTAWSTFFDGVSAVPPGVCIRVDREGARWRSHRDFSVDRQIRLPTYSDYVEEYRRLFLQSVQRRTRVTSPLGVLVSGGLDSSSLLCSIEWLRHAGVEMPEVIAVTNSFPDGSPGDESSYVRNLETHLGIEVTRLPMTHAALASEAVHQTYVTEAPVFNEGWASLLDLWEFLRGRGVRRYVTGLWGDQVLINQTYLVDLFDQGRFLTVIKHLREYPRTMTDVDKKVFVRGFVSDLARWHIPRSAIPLLRRARASLRGPRHDEPWYTEALRRPAGLPTSRRIVGGFARTPAHSRSFQARVRSVYYGSGLSHDGIATHSAGLETVSPYLDFDLLEFLMGVPGDIVTPGGRSRGLHRDAMKGLVPEMIRTRTDKGDGTRFGAESLAAQLPEIASWLGRPTRAAEEGLLDDSVFREWLEDVDASLREAVSFDDALGVLDVLGLEAWLRAYCPNS